MHNDSRESQDNCSTIAVSPWFGLSKPGPIEKARPHSVGHVNANGKAANIDCSSPVQDRIRHIVGQATKAGFATFDEAIEAYYTESFDETSQLDRDQRLSRNRRLPRLLGTLRDASKGWSHWERRGFQEQITQGAEDILVEELNLFKTQCPDLAFRRDIVNMELEMTEAGTNRIMSNSRKFQDHVCTFSFLSHLASPPLPPLPPSSPAPPPQNPNSVNLVQSQWPRTDQIHSFRTCGL